MKKTIFRGSIKALRSGKPPLKILILALSFISLPVYAEIYQCRANGKTQISRHPCAESDEQVTLKIKEKSTSSDIVVVTDRPTVDQKTPFVFDNFKWNVTNVYTFELLGSSAYPKYPQVETFIIVEIEIQNLAAESRYINNSMVLLAKGKQFEEAGMGGYAEGVMGYDAGYSIKIEPGITKKIYKTFDGAKESKYELIIREFAGKKSVGANVSWVRNR